MRTYTPQELRHAVLLAVVLTAIAMAALLDPSCHRSDGGLATGPSRSLYSR